MAKSQGTAAHLAALSRSLGCSRWSSPKEVVAVVAHGPAGDAAAWGDLPAEIVHGILGALDPCGRARLEQTSPGWRRAALQAPVWQHDMVHPGVRPEPRTAAG